MRRFRTLSTAFAASLLLPLFPTVAGASEGAGIRVKGGTRSLEQPQEDTAAAAAAASSKDDADEGKAVTHKRGRAPREPADRLPDDVPLSQPDEKARRIVAEGPTREALAKGATDAQLEALRQAEEVLFPKKVRGLKPSWSFELPEPQSAGDRALGLPLSPDTQPGAEISEEDAKWLRSLTMPDLPVRLDRRVVTYLEFYRDTHRGRTIAAIWARKSGRYVSAMKAKLRRAGLPTDLVWLSLIESGHDPTIRSPAGAVGLWQFMPETGRMYGLTVDRWVDERRDPARATEAAIRFLSDLYQRFGNWELAMASYNMGYAGMSRSIAKYNSNDYWTLSRLEGGIPWETSLYVPKIFALAIVMNNRQAFGLGRIQPDPAVSFDTIVVEPATPLSDVAAAAGVSKSDLQRLNPHLLASRVPPNAPKKSKKWSVRVPPGKGRVAQAKLAKSSSRPEPTIHVARLGDTVSTIAERYGVSERALERENSMSDGERLEPGTALVLPSSARKDASPPAPEVVAVSRAVQPGPNQVRAFYEVVSGDDLEEIASAFSVTVMDLVRWNALDGDARLRHGMTLQVLVPKDRDLSGVRHFKADGAKVLVAGSPEFHEYHESQNGKKRVEIIAREGDTLRSIGRRYGMSVGSMERVNRRSRASELVPGETLVVYTKRPVKSSEIGAKSEPLPDVVPPLPDLLPGEEAKVPSPEADEE